MNKYDEGYMGYNLSLCVCRELLHTYSYLIIEIENLVHVIYFLWVRVGITRPGDVAVKWE